MLASLSLVPRHTGGPGFLACSPPAATGSRPQSGCCSLLWSHLPYPPPKSRPPPGQSSPTGSTPASLRDGYICLFVPLKHSSIKQGFMLVTAFSPPPHQCLAHSRCPIDTFRWMEHMTVVPSAFLRFRRHLEGTERGREKKKAKDEGRREDSPGVFSCQTSPRRHSNVYPVQMAQQVSVNFQLGEHCHSPVPVPLHSPCPRLGLHPAPPVTDAQ